MRYCSNCGQQVDDRANFCSNCGAAIVISSENTQSQRIAAYDGVIHKCPNCGEILNSFTSQCPACGYELRGTTASNSVKELYRNIQTAKSDSEVVRLIKMFPVPNNKEDILEFMVLASSNFNEETYIEYMGEENISAAWFSKIEQCHKKATLSLSNEDMLIVNEIYSAITGRVAAAKKKSSQKRMSQRSEVTAREFKKSKFRVVLVVFSVISVLFSVLAFQNGRILAGLISALMVVLFLTAFLMGSGVIKERVRNFRLVPAIIAFLLFVPYFLLSNSNSTNHNTEKITEKIDWPVTGLGLLLPEPETNSGEIIFDNDEMFWLDLYAVSESDYESYVQACKENGFIVDGEKDSIGYEAYNEEGYHLSISYLDFSEEISIKLSIPKGIGDLIWPMMGPAALIPKPKSTKGSIEINSHIQLFVYVGETSYDDYIDYVEQCIERGFNVDFNRGDKVFDAENEAGDSLRVEYEGNNLMSISMYIHDREE